MTTHEQTPGYLTARELRDWLISNVDILDDPVTLPTGELVTGVGIGSTGAVLFDVVAEAE